MQMSIFTIDKTKIKLLSTLKWSVQLFKVQCIIIIVIQALWYDEGK